MSSGVSASWAVMHDAVFFVASESESNACSSIWDCKAVVKVVCCVARVVCYVT